MYMTREYISIRPIVFRDKEQFNKEITDIHIWVSNLTHGSDYEWSIASFVFRDRNGENEYPDGLFFYKREDMLAFKLRFNL
jgi:hypothetical protein